MPRCAQRELFEGPRSPGRAHAPLAACHADQETPGPANRDPDSDSRFPGESGFGDSLFAGQIGNRGFPPRLGFPAKNRESGPIRGIRFPIPE